MKKLFLTAVTIMAVASAMGANQVIESVAAYFGTHEQCKGVMDGAKPGTSDFDNALKAYHICRNSTVLEEIVIDVN